MARNQCSPEVRDRAVRMVWEHENEHSSQWAAIRSIAEKVGCSAEALRNWVRQAERDAGQASGPDDRREAAPEGARARELRAEARERDPEARRRRIFAQAELDRRAK